MLKKNTIVKPKLAGKDKPGELLALLRAAAVVSA